MSGCCQECNESNGSFTYIRFASDQYGSNISLLKNSGGIERCYQAIITSSIRLEETHPSFADYFTGKWFNVCNGESPSDSCCCVKFGFQKPSPQYNVWNFSEEGIQYQNNNSYVNAIIFDNMLNGQIFIVKPIVDNNGNNIQNNKNYYVKFHYDFSNLEPEDSVQISLGDGESASILSFDRSSGIGVYEGIMFASSGDNYPNDNLLFAVNTTNDLSANGLIYNFEFGSDKCFVTGPDNKWKKMNFGFAHTIGGLSTIESLASDAINSMYNPTSESDPNYNSNIVSNEEIPLFIGIVYPYDRSPKSFKVALIPNGKGSGKYGQNGNISLTPDDLVLIEKEDLSTDTAVTIIENDPNSNLVDLGDIGSDSFIDVINSSLNPYEITSTVNWYFRFTQNNLTFIYAFIGYPGVYGSGQSQTVLEDFFLVDTTGSSADLIVNFQTGVTYTIDDEDAKGKYIVFNNPSDIILTLPNDSTESFPIGSNFEVVAIGGGLVTVQGGVGVDIRSKNPSPAAINEVRRYVKIDDNLWVEDGDAISKTFIPLTAFVESINGVDATGELGNPNKPYKTIDGVFVGLTDSNSRRIKIELLNGGIHKINTILKTGITEIYSEQNVTIDLTDNTNTYLFTYNNGSLAGASFYFNIPNGKIQNLKSGGTGVSIAQSQTYFRLNVREIYWDSVTSVFFNAFNIEFQKLDIFWSKGRVSNFANMVTRDFVISSMTIPAGAVSNVLSGIASTVQVNSMVINVGSGDSIIGGGVRLRVGNISGTGAIRFQYHSGTTSIEFLNSVISIPIQFVQSIGNITFSGIIESCTIDTSGTMNLSTGTLNLSNLLIKNITSGWIKFYSGFVCNIINSTIKLPGSLFIRSTSGGVPTINITNSVIEMVTPTALIQCNFNTANVNIAGLETNALSIGNNSNVIVNFSLQSFKDKSKEIVVRSKVDLINKILDSTTTYVIDGTLTLLTGEYVDVPAGGLTLVGYGFDVSKIQKNVSGQSIYRSPVGGSGNFITKDIEYNSGVGYVFDIEDSDGSHAIEMNDVNFVGCSSIGIINGYRQFTGTTCGMYGCASGFTLDGAWNGFKLTNTNGFGFGSSAKLFTAGATLTFTNRFYIDMNISLPTGAVIADFEESNFLSDKLLQVVNCLVKVNGVIDPSFTSSLFSGIDVFSPKCYFSNNIGVKNSFSEPYGIKSTNLKVCTDDANANSQGINVGEFYIETSTGYLKQRLT